MKNNKVVYGWFDGEECFYVGMGSYRRSRSRINRNLHCSSKRKISEQKKTFKIKLFSVNLTREQACELEIELIQQFGRRDQGTGTLTNLTDGGESYSHWKGKTRSQATKDKIKKTLESKTDWKRGKEHHFYGKSMNKETKEKIRNTIKEKCRKGNKHWSSKKVQTPEGEFENMRVAAEHYKVTHQRISYMVNSDSDKFKEYYLL